MLQIITLTTALMLAARCAGTTGVRPRGMVVASRCAG